MVDAGELMYKLENVDLNIPVVMQELGHPVIRVLKKAKDWNVFCTPPRTPHHTHTPGNSEIETKLRFSACRHKHFL